MIAFGIKDFLVSQSIGTFGTDLFVAFMPDSPDDCIVIYDEPAIVLTENLRYDLDNFGFEILIRGTYEYCKAKCLAIHKIVPQLSGTYDSIPIHETFTQSPPAFVEVDSQGRVVYSIHYESECSIGATSRTSL